MRILIAEDDQVCNNLLKAQLEGEGHSVLTALDGIDAFTLIQNSQHPMDLIIADAQMPRVDGYTLLSMIKMNEKYKAIPFILYSAYFIRKSNEAMAYELGAERYVRKSGHIKDILDAVHSLNN